jgi:TonB family protein
VNRALSREAREAKPAGKVLVKCIISVSGAPTGCRIVKGLPFVDQAVLSALASARYQPFTFQGRPVNVDVTIPFTITW